MSTLLYKILLDYSYIKILGNKIEPFQLNVNLAKVLIGTIAISFIFLLINQFEKNVSHLLYNAYFYVMVVPISTVYGVCNLSTMYFFAVIIGSIICLLTINYNFSKSFYTIGVISESSWLIPFIAFVIVISVLAVCLYYLGLPGLGALNFKSVYDIRLHNGFIQNKFFNYIFSWTIKVILPFLICIELAYKKRGILAFLLGCNILFYLYTANKIVFFSMILIIGMYYIASFQYANYIMSILFTILMNLISIAALFYFYIPYSYLVRRVLILPAYLKFVYYDFFRMKPKIGLAGTLLGSSLGQDSQYPEGIGIMISKCIFKNDIMNSNTGFLAEGYYRFGILGVLLSCLILGIVIRLVLKLSERTSFVFATIFSIYPIYALNDALLIDSLIFGPMLIFVLVILFFSDYKMGGISYERRIKVKLH